ncbi:MAG: GTP-binding protein [bacterium]|nr:GTP-binding protein [bacterium]
MTDIAALKEGVLRFVAAGSVDDGKSTLIGRLLFDTQAIMKDQILALEKVRLKKGNEEIDLSLLTDGLTDEREQGITIDVAYRYFATPRRKFIIADVPGHEQYTRNMATGASTADLGIIVADARKGLLRQSRRHLYLLNLFGVDRIVIAVNKMDLVGYSRKRCEEIRSDFEEFAKEIGAGPLCFIPLSALRGDNVVRQSNQMAWYEGPPLLELLESLPLRGETEFTGLRFPVQMVCRPQSSAHQDYRGYMGRIESGTVQVGDDVVVYPSGMRTRVKGIDTYDGPLDEAGPSQSVTLLLEDEIDISRGDLIVGPDDPPRISQRIDALLFWMAAEPLDPRKRYLIKHGTRCVRSEVGQIHSRIDVETMREEASAFLGLNDIGRVRLDFQEPIAHDPYARSRAMGAFIVIDEDTNNTVAGGVICQDA